MPTSEHEKHVQIWREKIRGLLAPLDFHRDFFISRPMASPEVAAVEAGIGCSLPPILAALLLEVGMFQDIFQPLTGAPELFASAQRYIDNARALRESLGMKPELVAFSDDSADNLFALVVDPPDDTRVRLVDQEVGTVRLLDTFETWLETTVWSIVDGEVDKEHNSTKEWVVQFAFTGCCFDAVLELLRRHASVVPEGDWIDDGVSPAGVHAAHLPAKLDENSMEFERLEYADWNGPMYSFNYREPAALHIDDSMIAKLDREFSGHLPGYRLVNYGILPREGS